ncbi:multiple cyclophane-containing RiPP AmcA [Kitasatospora sp. NPDC057542]|uniref:multiple cyclophane-containing RiPP AmcA n=1 Tax=Kitasatospora sp. NPDC057542 TaxID=3346162 RepID=UPI0036BE470E
MTPLQELATTDAPVVTELVSSLPPATSNWGNSPSWSNPPGGPFDNAPTWDNATVNPWSDWNNGPSWSDFDNRG